MRAPLPWLMLALLVISAGLWHTDRTSLHHDNTLLQDSLTAGIPPALPEHHLIQVTFGNEPGCPQLTWLDTHWFTIRHGDGHLEDRPGRSMRHFQNQLNEQQRDYPQCPIQHWTIYGRFTPQALHFSLQ